MDTEDKKDRGIGFRDTVIVSTVFGALTIALLSLIIWQLIQYDLYRDLFIYLGIPAVLVWWVFSLALAFLIFRARFLPHRVASFMATVIFSILVLIVGMLLTVSLYARFGYPRFIGWLIYALAPILAAFVFLTVQLVKSLKSTGKRQSGHSPPSPLE